MSNWTSLCGRKGRDLSSLYLAHFLSKFLGEHSSESFAFPQRREHTVDQSRLLLLLLSGHNFSINCPSGLLLLLQCLIATWPVFHGENGRTTLTEFNHHNLRTSLLNQTSHFFSTHTRHVNCANEVHGAIGMRRLFHTTKKKG